MRSKKRIFTQLIALLIFTSLMSSCLTTKTTVGTFKEEQGQEYRYAKGKQIWLFWGLLPIGRTNVNTPPDGNCEIVTRFNVGDFLIGLFTGGIVTTYSIKVNSKRGELEQTE